MTDYEAIKKRRSRRTFTGPVPEAHQVVLQQEIEKLNTESGLNIQFLAQGAHIFGSMRKTYGMFSGVCSLFVLAGAEEEEHLLEKCGYYGERLVLEATKLDLGTCWVAGTYDRKAMEEALPQGQKLVAVIPVGPVKDDTRFIEKTIRALTHRRSKTVEDIANGLQEAPSWFRKGVLLSLAAPSAINKQPVRYYWQNGKVTAWVDEEQEIQLVDLGIAKLHFEVGAGGRFAFGNGAAFTKEKVE